MGIVRLIVVIIVVMVMAPVAWRLHVFLGEYLSKAAPKTAEMKFDEANRKCLVAEAAEGAASENDQVLIVRAMLRVAKQRNVDPCFLFTRYTLMREPSGEAGFAWPRDPDFVLAKGEWLSAAGTRNATAEKVVSRALKDDWSFAPGEPPEVELARHRMLGCVEKYIRVWRANTARTNARKMRDEMGESFTSPLGTVFFCPKKTA